MAAASSGTGVRDTAVDGNNSRLREAVRGCLAHCVEEAGVSFEELEGIYASGMITSNVGLCEVPHLVAPAGIDDFVQGVHGELLPDAQRLTPFGRRLRSTSLDELPELWNIFKGDMSIVGPRPLLVRYLPYYMEEEHHRHDVRPGLTGLAQVSGRNFLRWEERFALDVAYSRHITFAGDVKILLMTVKKVLRHDDIVVGDEQIMQDLDVERKERKEQDGCKTFSRASV